MAEIITVAGVAITLPVILQGAWTVLQAAYSLYGNVDIRRTQIRTLLDRCRDLIAKVAQSISTQRQETLSMTMLESIAELQRVCETVKEILEKLKMKGFLWCMIHQDKIDNQISDVEYQITTAFELFNFVSNIDRDKFQQDIRQARQIDQAELKQKLDLLSTNDQRILQAIQDQNGAQKRVEELLIAVQRCIESLDSEKTPRAQFLRSAGSALQRISKGHPQIISEDWVVTSLEVDFDTTGAIGQGSFGKVFTGQWNAARVAIKQMYSDDAHALTENDRKLMYKEVKLWTTLHHPNILSLYGACLEASVPFLLMQYCPFGNICDYLRTHSDANRIELSYDVVAGMSYLHNKRIVHADLKGVNILVDDKHNCLVADFGLSQAIDNIRSQSGHSTGAYGARGTLRWMAPECLDGESATQSSDIYSLGVTMWEIFSGEVPFAKFVDRLLPRLVVDQKKRPERPPLLETQDSIWELIQKCWDPNPTSRPSISVVQRYLELYTTRLSKNAIGTSPHPITSGAVSLSGETTVGFSRSQLETRWTQSIRSKPPTWARGSPRNFINALTIPQPPTDKEYKYRVMKGDVNLGVQPTYAPNADGSQTINLLEYNQGYGIGDSVSIKVYAVDPDEEAGAEVLVAKWDGENWWK